MKRYEYNYGKNPEGTLSTISGYATETTNFGETAFGILNKSTRDEENFTTPEVVSSSTATLFSVGNGTDHDSRKNIIELKADGTVYINGVGQYDGTNPGEATNIADEFQGIHDDITGLNEDVDRIDNTIESIHISEDDENLIYTLLVNGQERGTINIPRDQFLKNVSYNEETNNLEFTFIVRGENNEEVEKQINVNMTDLEDIYSAGDGLNLENKQFSVKVDADTQPYIEVTANGVKVIGIDEKFNTVNQNVTDLVNRVTTAENNIDNLEGRMDTAESDIDAIQSDLEGLVGDGEGSVQDQINKALEDYLPLSGGTMAGNIEFSGSTTTGIIIQGKSDTDLVNAAGGTTSIDDITSQVDLSNYATKEELDDYLRKDITELILGDNSDRLGSWITIRKPSDSSTCFTIGHNGDYLNIDEKGISIVGKGSSHLLNAGGSTTPISDIVTQVQSAIVDSAPETLDTLNELAAALGDDPNFATTVTNLIGTKVDNSKWETIANTNIVTSIDDFSYAEDSIQLNHKFILKNDNGSFDAESQTGKTINAATSTTAGVMSATDKAKLDSLATVATSGSYNDLTDAPTIPTVQSGQTGTNTNYVYSSAADEGRRVLSDISCTRAGDVVKLQGRIWGMPSNSSLDLVTLPLASSSMAGLMSTTDKSKLDQITITGGDIVASGFRITDGTANEVLTADGDSNTLKTINGQTLLGSGDIDLSSYVTTDSLSGYLKVPTTEETGSASIDGYMPILGSLNNNNTFTGGLYFNPNASLLKIADTTDRLNSYATIGLSSTGNPSITLHSSNSDMTNLALGTIGAEFVSINDNSGFNIRVRNKVNGSLKDALVICNDGMGWRGDSTGAWGAYVTDLNNYINKSGVKLYGKTSSDLLHAAGGTVSIDELKTQILPSSITLDEGDNISHLNFASADTDDVSIFTEITGDKTNLVFQVNDDLAQTSTTSDRIVFRGDKYIDGEYVSTDYFVIGHDRVKALHPTSGQLERVMSESDVTVKAASGTKTIWTGTQSEYEAVATKDANTLYFITEG